MQRTDAIVVGLGAHGGATAYQFAKRGLQVLGLDRFRVPHEQGSSHGESRIIREAYHEDPAYVPFVQRAYELWADLERESGRRLFVQTGGLMIGAPTVGTFAGAKKSAELFGLKHEILESGDVHKRFPAFHLEGNERALLEHRAGALLLPATLEAHLAGAKKHGADLRFDEPASSWSADESGVVVKTARGEYHADRLVLAAGAWLPELVPEPRIPLRVERQVMFWFKPKKNPADFRPDRFPVFIWETEDGHNTYGFPDLGTGFKMGIHHEGEIVDPNTVDRTPSQEDERKVRRDVARCFPDADGPAVAAKVCLYTVTPDTVFLLDHHPRHDNVIIASCCSGHGFKFASAVGEAAADLAMERRPKTDLSLFRLTRLLSRRF
ncbi:MAG TPA: N-methyl-L-tryptophan oxidase [Candidatus Thermoplasmatota archaeon]